MTRKEALEKTWAARRTANDAVWKAKADLRKARDDMQKADDDWLKAQAMPDDEVTP